jgi:four helix bundle protein
MKGDDLKKRAKEFAHRCVKLTMAPPNFPLGNHIRGQLIRRSTSVASNYRAACIAQSEASFISKLSIAAEEADESYFWLQFIIDENLLKNHMVEPLMHAADEITAILIPSRKTARTDNIE